MHPFVLELLPWVRQGYCCSQIMISLALQASGEENPALVRSMWGYCQGMAQNGQVCGTLLGSVACLSYFAGRGTGEAHPMAVPLVTEFVEWFNAQEACADGTACPQVTARLMGVESHPGLAPDLTLCGELMALCWEKATELLLAYGINMSEAPEGIPDS